MKQTPCRAGASEIDRPAQELTGRLTGGRRVAFQADDSAMNRAVTDGIPQAFEQGLLADSSVLAGDPGAGPALGQ